MRALTLHQPWASFVACGAKQIETRSWPTKHRGPIAIHAGKRRPTFAELRASGFVSHLVSAGIDPSRVDEWRSYQGDETDWVWTRIAEHVACPGFVWDGCENVGKPIPLGAVVAVGELTDCFLIDRETSNPAPVIIDVDRETGRALSWKTVPVEQRPFGDWAPGRWAWMLSDVFPLDPPIPATGHQGLWTWSPVR